MARCGRCARPVDHNITNTIMCDGIVFLACDSCLELVEAEAEDAQYEVLCDRCPRQLLPSVTIHVIKYGGVELTVCDDCVTEEEKEAEELAEEEEEDDFEMRQCKTCNHRVGAHTVLESVRCGLLTKEQWLGL